MKQNNTREPERVKNALNVKYLKNENISGRCGCSLPSVKKRQSRFNHNSRQISNRGRESNMQAAVSMATELWGEKKKKHVAFNKFQVF